MLNRSLQVKVVKNKDAAGETVTTQTTEETVEIINHTFDNAVKKVAFALCSYVIVDTLRQIVVARAIR